MTEKDILHAMKTLDLSREEAIEMLQEDAEIDRGADPHPLTAEQKQTEKKMRQADRAPTVYQFKKRERKPNTAKREIISVLDDALCDIADNVTVTNIERQIDFELDGVRYRVVLSAPRKAKEE